MEHQHQYADTYNKCIVAKYITLSNTAISLKQLQHWFSGGIDSNIAHKYLCWHIWCKLQTCDACIRIFLKHSSLTHSPQSSVDKMLGKNYIIRPAHILRIYVLKLFRGTVVHKQRTRDINSSALWSILFLQNENSSGGLSKHTFLWCFHWTH